jgi:hypothetical protein
MKECENCEYKDTHGTICAICMGNNGNIPNVDEVGL